MLWFWIVVAPSMAMLLLSSGWSVIVFDGNANASIRNVNHAHTIGLDQDSRFRRIAEAIPPETILI